MYFRALRTIFFVACLPVLLPVFAVGGNGFVSAKTHVPPTPLTATDVPGDGEYGKADLIKVRIYVRGNTFNVKATVEGLGRVDELMLSLTSSKGDYMYINHEAMGDTSAVWVKCKVKVKSNRDITLTVPLSCLPDFTQNKPIKAIVHLVEGPMYPEVAYTIIDSIYTDSFMISAGKSK